MLDIAPYQNNVTESRQRDLRRIPAIRARFRYDDTLFEEKTLGNFHKEGVR